MACQHHELIDLFLADELESSDRVFFSEHLLSCEECHNSVNESRMLDELLVLGNAREAVDPKWLDQAVEAIERASQPISRRPIVWGRQPWLVAAGCLAAALIVAVGIQLMPINGPSNDDHTGVVSAKSQDASLDSAGPFQANSTSNSINRPTVVAMEGFLAARVPSVDDSMDFYWVLPTKSKF